MATDVIGGTVTANDGAALTVELFTDPDVGETLTVDVPIPGAGAVDDVAYMTTGTYGAVALTDTGSDPTGIVVEFRTYAELRAGITVPRPPATTTEEVEDDA